MVKIKGWKKHKKDDVWFSERSSIDIGKAVKIVDGVMVGFRDDLYILNITINHELYKNKKFKTKQQAIKFAINYMKKHPRG